MLDLLVQFTGDGGGHRPSIVPYGIAAMMWFGMLQVARFKYRPVDNPHEALLVWGFSIALGRELLMLTVKVLEAFSIFSIEQLHLVFPPAEHALSNISTIVVIAAFGLYFTGESRVTRKYMLAGIASVVLVYLLTFWWWADYISANPDSKFGQTWCDWIFRINASFWIGLGWVYLWIKVRGWRRKYICAAIGLFFLNDFLKIPDMALDEVYEGIFAPIRQVFYMLGILFVGYVYLRGHSIALLDSYTSLETAVQERTAELARANAELLELSRIDPLTQLANRRGFEQDYLKLRAGVSRSAGSIAVMIIDIDHFKLVNDTHGHQAGDRCLQIIGTILADTFKRGNDIVARYGGEEFIAVVTNENLHIIQERAEQLREEIAATTINLPENSIKLTVSIGLTYRESLSRDDTDILITLADEALYKAKNSGRNRVVCIN